MAQRYQRDTLYSPPGADFSAVDTANKLASALSSFSKKSAGQYQSIRAEQGKLAGSQVTGTPKLKSNFTLFGQAYNNAALRNYVIGQEVEIEKELGRLESESPSDPEGFTAKADGIRKALMKSSLPEARGDINQLFQRRLAEGVLRLDGQRIVEQKKFNRGMLEQGLEVLSDGIARKYSSGKQELIAEAEEDEVRYNLMIDGSVADGTISPIEAKAMKRDGVKRITSQVITGQFEGEVTRDGGDPLGFLERLINQPAENLSDDEKQELIGNLFQRLSRRNSLINMAESLEVDSAKARFKAGEKHATMLLLDGKLTSDTLEKLVAKDYLDPTVARSMQNELESGGPAFNDDRERFHVETNLLELSEDEIAKNPRLTWDSRRALIEKRRDLAAGWRSTQQALEGAERIDRALGIVPGIDSRFLSDDERRARDQAMTEWYDSVDALDPAERQAKAIELSETVIKKVIRSNASNELRQLESRLRSYQSDKDPEKLRGAALKEYQDTVARYERQIAAARARAEQ